LAGDPGTTDFLRAVHVLMDALHVSFDEALDRVGTPAKHRDAVRHLHEQQATQLIERVRGVSARGGPRAWFADWDPARGFYWPRQRAYLLDHVGRTPQAVEATDDDSDRVLQYLENPRGNAPFNTRGLVIGHVQSGKTENFSALIAKAADAGYKVVIVLSGVHNTLRQQTQRRLERELGLTDVAPGVGRPEAGKRWHSATNADLYGDFHPGTSDASILQGNEKVIFVVKKWHTVLQKLVDFVEAADPPHDLPVLVIDDEADQASINTGGNRQPLDELIDAADGDADVDLQDEVDPSTTNRLIRDLLRRFQRVAYVAYTATPFANVLIDHRAEDREVYEDLFPKDFILTLFPRPGYVGAERLFGRDALERDPEDGVEGLDVIRLIPVADQPAVTPSGVKVADFRPSVPESLELALRDWVLATGGLLAREGEDRPSSMLIHVHQRTSVQNLLAPQVAEVVRHLRNDWRYDSDGGLRAEMRARWEEEFRTVSRRLDPERDMPFEQIEEHIDRLLKEGVPVLTLNSTTDDQLDYEQDPNLKAVLIGGNRLSRGVTLEGLLVSYYVRETPYMDTLLQMGRWFGYRESYVDLTRIWTTELLASWFRDIALREEELRQQVLQGEREQLWPERVGYRIRSHPAMLVTSQLKMGSGRPENVSYAHRMIQTTRFRLDNRPWLTENLTATRELFATLGGQHERWSGRLLWRDVEWGQIERFLRRYRTLQDRTSFDADAAADYIRKQAADNGELLLWDVAIQTQQRAVGTLGTEDLHVAGVPAINTIARTRLEIDRLSVGVLTNAADPRRPCTGDEEIGLSLEALQHARQERADGLWEKLRDAVLDQRPAERGLLVVYPISRFSLPRGREQGSRVRLFDDPEGDGETVIGCAVAFPPSISEATREYISGSAGRLEDE
jgi:Z1 domain